MKKSRFLIFMLFLLTQFISPSVLKGEVKYQRVVRTEDPLVENVHYTVNNGSIIIRYDLMGLPNKNYKVTVELRKESDSSFFYVPKIVSGDIGIGKFAGKGREITWAFNQEFPDGLPGKDYYFVVSAQELSGSPRFLTWIGMGVAAVAATATYLIISKKNARPYSGSPGVSFPPPPGRPK